MGPLAALARVDLNLLTAFRAVDETRNVTRAAKLLGVTQPALSHALRRLRATFGDPLFVKARTGVALTPFAESIAAPVRDALARLEREVFERGPFRPEALARTFQVRTTDYAEGLIVPPLLASLHAAGARDVRVAVTPVGVALPKAELEAGACDLAIAGFFDDVPSGFRRQALFEDRFACAARRGHPRLGRAARPTLDAFAAEAHVLVAPSGTLAGAVDAALAKHRRKRTVVAGASGFMAGALVAARSDCVLTAPSRLLDALAGPLRLVTFPPPSGLALPPLRILQVWHARSHADPAHVWFRELVARACA